MNNQPINSQDHVEIAQYHFYLTQAILEGIPEEFEGVGDVFGCGEDSLVYELYPLTVQWHQFDELLYREDRRPSSITVIYEVPDVIAKLFWLHISTQINDEHELMSAVLPNHDAFNEILIDAMKVFSN
ncbi:hypothetical protein TUM4438_10180 [Shewanella sairae]|uniref:Uncharacterized protein n=1 Tax=Shewanella sairae TaxID=190310 RepID=A0ABQ4P5Q8_9GAMM|nr:hypothetical protein [Shewanella sairae]MCL1130452.1 hypothetical protein [Shewanella sairae]GIU42794.1 hypothetical protein TUM4438_10180 [Shewanella sairae]